MHRKIFIHRMRRNAEHFAFAGAATDFLISAVGAHAPAVALLGKAAFAAGALAIYLLHYEEHLPEPARAVVR